MFDQRANRVAERILRDFTESDACARACTTIMARRMTPDRAKGLAEKGGQQLAAVLAADGVSVFRLEAMARLDAAFTSQHFERTREAIQIVIDALLSDVPEPMEPQILRALLEDLRDASDLTQSKERLRWIVETLLKPGNGQILETVLDRVLDALQRDEHREALTRGVAIYAEILFRAVLEYWRGTYVDPDDPSLLSVKESAAYLGIRPYSLHTHIRRRANTAAEVPARLTKAVGGRKTYVLPLAELKVWEQTHWRPGRRAPRGPA